MKIYAVQSDIVWEDKPANFARVERMVAQAVPEAGSLIVLAEMFATGFSSHLQATLDHGESREFLRALAVKHQCAVIGGLVGCGANGMGRNQAVAFAPDGQELACYSKIQPFSLGTEREVHEPGTEVVSFEFGGIKIAPFVCFDLRFPELARAALRQGAEVLVYIASWPIKRTQHWVTLLQARAIENQAWVVGVNRCGTDPEFTYPGRTLVVDPHGTIIADAADRQGVLCTTLDPVVARSWRAEFPAVRDFLASAEM